MKKRTRERFDTVFALLAIAGWLSFVALAVLAMIFPAILPKCMPNREQIVCIPHDNKDAGEASHKEK